MIVQLILSMLLHGLSPAAVQPARPAPDEVTGIWISEKRNAKVLVYYEGKKLFGKLSWVQDEGAKDRNNPDLKLRSRPLLGLNILSGFEPDGKNAWSGGKIYDPESGKTYSCKMKMQGGKLEIRGYVGISMFGRTSIWTRL